MNDERTDLARRAARFAALGDPVRLRIVDILSLGDHSPGELQAATGIGSNLLAHHLGVLENEGMIVRTRSEGDRRRSYVHLRPDALTGLVPTSVMPVQRIVFVCTGNSSRSPLAEALWARASTIPATSAGTHPAAQTSAGVIAAARRRGLTLPPRPPQALDGVVAGGDYVVTVCDRAHEELGPTVGAHWSVPNPGRVGSPEAYDAMFDDIALRVHELAPRLTAA